MKHIHQFRGPLLITEKPSNTTFKLESHFTKGKVFFRNLSNVRRWNGPIPSESDRPTVDDDDDLTKDIEAGEIIIAREDTDKKILDVAKIVSIDDSTVQVHCYGTMAKNPLTAKYTPVLTHTDKRKRHHVILWKPRKNQKCTPWTWHIKHADFDDLVLARAITLKKDGSFSASAKRKINALSDGFRIKRFRST